MRDEADNLLRLFLNATDKAKETRLLEQLIGEHALPRIRQILRAKLRGDWMQDLEDLIHDVALLLVNKLRKLKTDPDSKPISDFDGYFPAITYNVFNDYLHKKYPQLQTGDDVERESDSHLSSDNREYLQKLWIEIRQLNLKQRCALLLNGSYKKGDDDLTTLLVHTRIATMRQVAKALEITDEEFVQQVWDELPWNDAKIAEYLGVTQREVINLRNSARRRLWRRMGE
jgi:DNA-directed RNA polymerase specialized sigma24 family protein